MSRNHSFNSFENDVKAEATNHFKKKSIKRCGFENDVKAEDTKPKEMLVKFARGLRMM